MSATKNLGAKAIDGYGFLAIRPFESPYCHCLSHLQEEGFGNDVLVGKGVPVAILQGIGIAFGISDARPSSKRSRSARLLEKATTTKATVQRRLAA